MVYADDDFAVVESTGRATHDGTLRSPAGDVQPTGRTVENRFCEVLRIEAGKISRSRTYLDLATMMDGSARPDARAGRSGRVGTGSAPAADGRAEWARMTWRRRRVESWA